MLTYGATSIVENNEHIHIVYSSGERGVETLCNQFLPGKKKYKVLKAFDKPPTCPECIKKYFNKENENTRLERNTRVDEVDRMNNVFCSLFDDTINVARRRSDMHRSNTNDLCTGSHPFIPYSSIGAYSIFRDLKKWLWTTEAGQILTAKLNKSKRRRAFLDAGCGIGNILMIAKKVGLADEYHGLEYFDNVKSEAEHFLGLDMKYHYDDITIKKANIATYNSYEKYDFIYYYCPFSNGRKEKEFEIRVEDQMRVGAILIPMRKNSSAIAKDKRFREIMINQFRCGPYLQSRGMGIWEKISE